MPTDDTAALPEQVSAISSVDLLMAAFDFERMPPEAAAAGPDRVASALREVLPSIINEQHERFERARALYLREDATGTAARVFERMDAWLSAGDLFDPRDLCSNEEFKALIRIAAQAERGGDLDTAALLYAVLELLRPDQPQPFVNHYSIVWQTLGVQQAADCYALTAPLMDSPVYFYYAADCMEHAGREEHARLAIKVAQELIDDPDYPGEITGDLKQRVRASYERLDADRLDAADEPPAPGGAVFV
jgi:hypothetical protein